MQKTQFTLRQYIGKDNIAKLFGQEKANDESFINRRVVFVDEQTQLGYKNGPPGVKTFRYQIDGTLNGFYLKCGLTPENKEILFGQDIPLLKREQRNVMELNVLEYSYKKDRNRIDVSWVDKLSKQYGISNYAVAYLGNNENLYKTLDKYYFDIKDPRILKALHERYDVDYLTDVYMPKDLRDAIYSIDKDERMVYHYLAEYMEQNFMRGKQPHQESIDMSTEFNEEPNQNQIYAVKRIYEEQPDFDIVQMEQMIFVTEDPAVALAYVQKYNNIKDNSTLYYPDNNSFYTVDVITIARDNDILNRSPKDVLDNVYNDSRHETEDLSY